jgi:hypothetical protein
MRLDAILKLCGLIGLVGCASPQEIAAADCRSYGLTPGTEAYVSCVMQDSRGSRGAASKLFNGIAPQTSGPPIPQVGSAGQSMLPPIGGLLP